MPYVFQELLRGQQVRLIKYNSYGNKSTNMDSAIFSLSWSKASADCDLSIILCDREGKIIDGGRSQYLVYFKNLHHPSDSVLHLPDAIAGTDELDEEQIIIDFSSIPSTVETLEVVANVYTGQLFKNVTNPLFRIIDPNRIIKYNGTEERYEVARYDISADEYNANGLIIGQIFRRWFEPSENNEDWTYEWRFRVIGEGVANASRLSTIVNRYK